MFGCVCTHRSEELGEYMESKGASTPGILTLTTSLSKPFTRLERYPALLKELDRHMEVRLNNATNKDISKQMVSKCFILGFFFVLGPTP